MANKELTATMFKAIFPHTPKAIRDEQLPLINQVMRHYNINNERRIAAFLATLGEESGDFRYRSEIASGDAYDTRTDLGNTAAVDGDGRLYKGHGRIQITGKTNHRLYTDYLRSMKHLPFVDFVLTPKKLAEDPYALDSAGWYFTVLHDLNALADRRQFLKLSIKVNGRNRKTGLPNNWNNRLRLYNKALEVLPDDIDLSSEEGEPLDTPLPDEYHSDVKEAIEAVPIAGQPQTPTQAVESAASAMAHPEAKISKSSLIVTVGTTIASILAAMGVAADVIWKGIGNIVTNNPAYLIFAVLFVILAALGLVFYDRAQERATKRQTLLANASQGQVSAAPISNVVVNQQEG